MLFIAFFAKKMPHRCVVVGCDSCPDPEIGLSLHKIPFFNDNRPEAIRRRRRWVLFVQRNRSEPNPEGKPTAKPWKPSRDSAICSKHFKDEDFTRRFHKLPGQSKAIGARLMRDEFGISAYPTVHTETTETQQPSARDRRRVSFELNPNI